MKLRVAALTFVTLLGCRERQPDGEARGEAVEATQPAPAPIAEPEKLEPATAEPEKLEPATAEPATVEGDDDEGELDDRFHDPEFVCPREDGCSFVVDVEVCEGPKPAVGARVLIGLASGVVGADGRLRLELPPQTGNHKGIGVMVQYNGEVVHNRIYLRDQLRVEGVKLALGDGSGCPPREQPAAKQVAAKPASAPADGAAAQPYLHLGSGPSFERNGEECSFELESMPESRVFDTWLELYDWMARDTDVDDGRRPKDEAQAKEWLHVDGGGLVLAVIWPHGFYTSYAAVLERDDGLLQLWKLGQPIADDECPLGPQKSDHELALPYVEGLETISVDFEDSDHDWGDEDERPSCGSADLTRVNLIVEPNSNISTLVTRVLATSRDDGKGPGDVMELRLEDDGLYVDGCGLQNKRLIRTVPGRPGYPN